MENIFWLWWFTLIILIGFLLRRLYEFPMPLFLSFLLDSKLRKKIQPAEKIINISEMKKGSTILDLGCGPGSYTLDFARALGKEGKVYAVDIQFGMLKKLKKKLQKPENKDIQNVEMKIADACQLPFSDNFFDIVYLISVLPEIRDKTKVLKEVRRVLKNSGNLIVSETIFDPDYPLKGTTKKWCQEANFEFKKSLDRFFSYCFQFKKKWN